MMNLREISISANGLGGQLQAGVPLDAALDRMRVVQPGYEEFWLQACSIVNAGRPLSECLHDIWPSPLVKAVQAGEQAGKLKEVFERIQESIAVEQGLRAAVSKLNYPLGSALAGLCVSLWYFAVVIPNMMKSLSGHHAKSFILNASMWLSELLSDHWLLLLIGTSSGIFLLVNWLRTEAAKTALLDFALGIPKVKDALRDLYFGLWAYYMEMAIAAGIPTTNALVLTAPILPDRMRESVEVFNADMALNNRPMGESADLSKQEPGDPRVEWWPFYIANSFILAEQTGLIDAQLKQCAPILIKDGTRTLTSIVNFGNIISIALAAILIVAPMGAYYVELFGAARTMGR